MTRNVIRMKSRTKNRMRNRMKRLFSSLLLLAVLSALLSLSLSSCKGGDLNGLSVQGLYYEYSEATGRVDEKSWIEIRSTEWGDSSGHKGSFEISGEVITLLLTENEETTEYATGTVSGGKLTLEVRGSERIYHRE